MDLTKKKGFKLLAWFKFSNLRLVLDMALKFYSNKTKFKNNNEKVLRSLYAFDEVIMCRLVERGYSPILCRVKKSQNYKIY